MPGFTFTESVRAPIPAVFEAFTDFANAPARVPGIVRTEVLTPGPVGVGTKFKETRIMFKREATETFEVTRFVRNELVELVAVACGSRYRTLFTFAPDGDGTRVGVDFDVTGVSFFAKLMTPLAALMKGTIRKCIRADIDGIRKSLEAEPVATA